MAEPFIGQIICLGCNFAPVGWLYCNGQPIPISQYDTLYNLLGTTYGGDGVTTFNVPDLRGRVPVHQGTGQGLSTRVMGQMAGEASVSLNTSTMPGHQHLVRTVPQAGDQSVAAPGYFLSDEGPAGVAINTYQPYSGANQVALAGSTVGPSPGGQPHDNQQPFQAVTFAIATTGIYPSQG